MQTIDISYPLMLSVYGLLLLPVLILYFFKIDILTATITSVLRMTIQLVMVALYLERIFRINNIWINFGWIVVMLVIANVYTIKSSGLKLKKFFPRLFAGFATGTLLVVFFFVFIAVNPVPFYDARYLIPITGMVLGNCLRANVISLERFYSSIRKNEKEFLTYLLMGATLNEAVLPYMQDAMKSALAPSIATMATLGLVSLPGMMTGQILGGSLPVVAIKYQICIMIAIFCAIVITAMINLRFSLRVSFNEYQILDKGIFSA